jgi:hypothetical protein
VAALALQLHLRPYRRPELNVLKALADAYVFLPLASPDSEPLCRLWTIEYYGVSL